MMGRRVGPKRLTRAATPKNRVLRVTQDAATNFHSGKWARPVVMVISL